MEVDDATAARLAAEQMLEVTDTRPAVLETEPANGTDLPADSTAAAPSPPAPAPDVAELAAASVGELATALAGQSKKRRA